MVFTVSDAITDALVRIGVGAAGETPSSEDMATGFQALNILTDGWGTERLTIPYIARTTATLTASQTSFTVGSGGDIDIVRPVFFTNINYIDTSQSPELELPLSILTDDAWAGIHLKGLTSTLPTQAYYNPTYSGSFGTLYPWPVPTSATLEWAVYSPVAVPEFSATTASIVLPPGYRRFIVTNLAVEIAPMFNVEPSQSLIIQAIESKADIKRANIRPSDMSVDSGALVSRNYTSSYYRFLSGQ